MINNSALPMFEKVIAAFSVNDKEEKDRFFKKTFLLANICLDVVFVIFFLTLSNADIKFMERQLLQQTYITAEALLTTGWVKVMVSEKISRYCIRQR